jgi:uroporphyrinogen-III synthase
VIPLLVLTRDDRLDDALTKGAAARGLATLRLALLEAGPGRDVRRFLDWLSVPPEGVALAWTSRRAGEAIAGLALPGRRSDLARVPLYAVGAESAAPVRAAGLDVLTPAGGSPDAKQLAALIAGGAPAAGTAGAAPKAVAFLRGDRSLPDLPDALRQAGIEVEAFELYSTRFLSPDPSAAEQAAAEGRIAAIAFFSPSGVEALERVLAPATVARIRREVLALARGETTRAALASRGYRRASGPASAEAFDSFALAAVESTARASS